jgi:hypothetical protein
VLTLIPVLVCRAEQRYSGDTRLYGFFSQWFALFPGIPGSFLRAAFYRGMLDGFGQRVTVGFGALISQTEAIIGDDVYIGAYACNGVRRTAHAVLPIGLPPEIDGSYTNLDGTTQVLSAAAKLPGDARPGWKVLRVLANLLELPGFDFESAQDVLKQVPAAAAAQVPVECLGNSTQAGIDLSASGPAPVVASIYQLDGLVRRATSLQLTADARQALAGEGAAA